MIWQIVEFEKFKANVQPVLVAVAKKKLPPRPTVIPVEREMSVSYCYIWGHWASIIP